MDNILKELQEIKNLTLLGAKQALTMNDAALFTGLSKSHLYKLVCFRDIPSWMQQNDRNPANCGMNYGTKENYAFCMPTRIWAKVSIPFKSQTK